MFFGFNLRKKWLFLSSAVIDWSVQLTIVITNDFIELTWINVPSTCGDNNYDRKRFFYAISLTMSNILGKKMSLCKL
jgi:hypothetical protein